MFDVAPSELLLVVIVAIVVIGPKDLPMALRTAGRWIGRIRRVSNHFRSGIETMIREAELEEMERKWKEQNAAIMAAHPQGDPAAGQTIEAAQDQNAPVDPSIAAHAPTEALAAPVTEHGAAHAPAKAPETP
ncbi:Sec-independent protein translocase protein TatB [Novosphingobium olei]|uniref:Sec-independent protein translocase protein TatB n=1 Tax=Novosphingobium olei TaxID=2728851 RepID=A0A7Y0BLG8_9SPHN|nr:Sec-independent protein translocase protein TatB [Novosphingobium olei]NML92463.1 twin-arginine translocase subunit TatB [Novosphingobium olei]BEV01681.1 Sec-independent protein translocase protein TatB [Novosphingobium olei]